MSWLTRAQWAHLFPTLCNIEWLCQVTSVVSDSARLHRRQSTRPPHPWYSPGKNTGVGCHFLLQCMKVKSLSLVQLPATPWTAVHQAPPSMGFSKQEYWSGVPLNQPKVGVFTPQKLANTPRGGPLIHHREPRHNHHGLPYH